MGRRRFDRERETELEDRQAYRMCLRKRKLKSAQAGKLASRFNQRKYRCPLCGHWHLTKHKGSRHD